MMFRIIVGLGMIFDNMKGSLSFERVIGLAMQIDDKKMKALVKEATEELNKNKELSD